MLEAATSPGYFVTQNLRDKLRVAISMTIGLIPRDCHAALAVTDCHATLGVTDCCPALAVTDCYAEPVLRGSNVLALTEWPNGDENRRGDPVSRPYKLKASR